MEKKQIKNTLLSIINNKLGKTIEDMSKNLFSSDTDPFEFLYVVKEIEEHYRIKSEDLFADSDYTIMTIDNLTNKIYSIIDMSVKEALA